MTSTAEPERFEGQRVSAAYFRALGVLPALGRDFQPPDDLFKGPNVVILSDGLWRRRLGSDRTVVGRQVTLDDNLYTVIGVRPAPSKMYWLLLRSSGYLCNTTPHFPKTAGNGDTAASPHEKQSHAPPRVIAQRLAC
jgi:hypothetical protein